MEEKLKQAVYERFGDQFDFSKFVYANAKTKSTLICKDHGEFQVNPDKIKQNKYVCPTCAKEKKRSYSPRKIRHVLSKEDYLKKVRLKHGENVNLDLSNYNGLTKNNILVICEFHGEEEIKPVNLLARKHTCNKCGTDQRINNKTKSFIDFVEAANKIHNQKYNYIEENFVNRKSVVLIECKKHGIFKKKAQKHLSGQGCYKCKLEDMKSKGILGGGYNLEYFESFPDRKNILSKIYYLKVGDYYKIGITTNFKNRMKDISSKSKMSVEVLDVQEMGLFNCYLLEQQILNFYYKKRVFDQWSTELFCEDVLNGSILNFKEKI